MIARSNRTKWGPCAADGQWLRSTYSLASKYPTRRYRFRLSNNLRTRKEAGPSGSYGKANFEASVLTCMDSTTGNYTYSLSVVSVQYGWTLQNGEVIVEQFKK